MLDIVGFLETVGGMPEVPGQTSFDTAYATAVTGLQAADEVREALHARDVPSLVALAGGRTSMTLQIWAPDENAPQHVPLDDEPAPSRRDDDDEGDAPLPESPERRG